jgi:hypothetical protein
VAYRQFLLQETPSWSKRVPRTPAPHCERARRLRDHRVLAIMQEDAKLVPHAGRVRRVKMSEGQVNHS